MHAYISVCLIGVFAVDENRKIIEYKLFSKNPEEIADKIRMFNEGKEIPEAEELKNKLKGYEIVLKQPNICSDFLKENFRKIALEKKFAENQAELNELLVKVGIAQAKEKISVSEKRDKFIIQTVSALNDMDKILNSMSERLREWYGLHYPEFDVNDHYKFAEEIAEYGHRKNFRNFKKSIGIELNTDDIELLKKFAKELKELYNIRKGMEKHLDKIVPEEMPNTCALLGSLLCARLLALAGSMEKLAKMPSSTIQLLGSEKSLFKFLRAKGNEREKIRCPRFGILFTHPDISSAQREKQGKIARLLASKLTIAVRADFYSKEDRAEKLKEEYRNKLKNIMGN